jgi:hypothetical protein
MSTNNAPFGMRPVRHLNGKFVPPPRAIPGGIASGYDTSIYFQGPVLLNTSGQLEVATTTNDFYGVFAGCQYVSSSTGLLTPSMYWPANTAYVAGTLVAYVWEDPNIIYEIQANGSIASTAVGNQADFSSAIAAGSTTTGLSSATISSSLETAGQQGQLSIRGLGTEITNTWGDAYTIVEVQIAQSQFVANKVSF